MTQPKPKPKPKAPPLADPEEGRKLAALGPNEKFPYGLRIQSKDGHVSFERYGACKDRDLRLATLAQGLRSQVTPIEYVDRRENRRKAK